LLWIGPSADDPVGLLGNYNGISSKQVTPLEGITKQFSGDKIAYALGATYTPTAAAIISTDALAPPDGGGHGLLAEYYDNPDFQGDPKLKRTEARLYYDANMEEPAVVSAINGKQVFDPLDRHAHGSGYGRLCDCREDRAVEPRWQGAAVFWMEKR